MKRILSGIQPTGNLHLGNYLGAIRNWVKLQDGYECFYMLADLHAITVPQEPEALRKNVRESAAALIACGVDPSHSAIFVQSAVPAHAELAWIFSCMTPLGWLNRMTQFKEKRIAIKWKKGVSDEQKGQLVNAIKKVVLVDNTKQAKIKWNEDSTEDERKDAFDAIEKILIPEAELGLFSYPVLMAADILVYRADYVPVGEDQKQHLELCRDIAGAFNRAYNTEYFVLPEPVIMKDAARVMSLRDGTKKMSKSDESEYSRINLTDDADAIAKKFKKATSDSFTTIGENIENRPEANNLLTIYAALKGVTREQALAECGDKNFSAFKQMLTDVAVAHLSPITAKMRELLASPDYLDQVLAKGTEAAGKAASQTMKEVKQLVGFLEVAS